MIIRLSILVCTIILLGCTNEFSEIKKEDLEKAFIINSSPTFQGYYYLGSDLTYHYFKSRWKFEKDKWFKINKNELRIRNEFSFKASEIKLTVFNSPKQKKIFATYNNTTIYQIEE